jgi:hypothetical protein
MSEPTERDQAIAARGEALWDAITDRDWVADLMFQLVETEIVRAMATWLLEVTKPEPG